MPGAARSPRSSTPNGCRRSPRRLDVDVFAGGPAIRRAVTRLGVAQSIVAVFERPAAVPAARLTASGQRLVVVEALDNPANVGAVVRSAAALGWDGLLLDRESADPLARRSLRVAMGTAFALPHARVDDVVGTLVELQRLGVTTYGLTPDGRGAGHRRRRPTARAAPW